MRKRVTSVRSRISLRLGDERGVALVLALVIMGVLTITVASVATFTTSNENHSARDRDVARALGAAEAGLNNGLAVLTQQDSTGTQPIGATLATTSFTIDGGSGTYSATKNSGLEWTISATGTSPNGRVTRKLELKLDGTQSTQSTQQSPVYGYGFFVNATTGCTTIAGNSPVQVSVFVRNDLCLTGNAAITQPGITSNTLTVYVGGRYTATANPTVAANTQKVANFTAVNGCQRQNSNVICSTSAQSKVYSTVYSSTPSSVTKPTTDAAAVYASGNWHNPVCSVGSFVFDGDTTLNGSLGSVDLLQSNARPSFDCTVWNQSGTAQIGRLAWNVTTKVLTISGTILLDGGLTFSGQSSARYTGFGSIYANGSVGTSGQAAICGPPAIPNGSSCTGNWDPAQGALTIVALNGWSMSGQSEFNVIAFVNGAFSATGGAVVTGPAIADTATLSGNGKFATVTTVPPGTPGAASSVTTTTWKVLPGSWRQLLTGL
jgi:Tfp pilus assembly protein PilX